MALGLGGRIMGLPLTASAKNVAFAYLRGHRKVSMVDESLIKWFAARVQKKKGIVQMNVVEQAFDQMEGWSIVPTTTFLTLNGNYDLQRAFLEDLARQIDADNLGRALTMKEPVEFHFAAQQDAEAGLKKYNRLVNTKTSAKAKKPSGKAESLRLYSSDAKVGLTKWGSGFAVVVGRMWVGVPGWHLKSAKGTSVDLPSPMTIRGKPLNPNRLEKFTKFWTWGYKNGLVESAKAVLDAADPSQVELATATKAQRKRLEVQRITLPEVRALLVTIVRKKFQEVWDHWDLAKTKAVREYMEAMDAAWADAKAKGETYPRWEDRKGYRNSAMEYFRWTFGQRRRPIKRTRGFKVVGGNSEAIGKTSCVRGPSSQQRKSVTSLFTKTRVNFHSSFGTKAPKAILWRTWTMPR